MRQPIQRGKQLSPNVATLSQLETRPEPAGKTPHLRRRSLAHELQIRGIRMTAQRRLLVGIIQDASRHLDAASLLHLAKQQDPAIDRATIYRTLGTLKKLGLIDELDLMHLEGEKHFYEAKTNRDHCHLACFRCGSIVEYASAAFEALKREITKRGKFNIGVIRLEAGGVCSKCRSNEPKTSANTEKEIRRKAVRSSTGRKRQ
jgi:Fur family transcriptional regulator, ferric uptake regulator